MPPKNIFLAMLSTLICVSSVSAAELKCWSYVPHPPLLVDWMDPAPAIFTNDSVFDRTRGP